MRITVFGRDLEVAPGTPLREIAAFVSRSTGADGNVGTGGTAGTANAQWWCGATALTPSHLAGTVPLLHGAVLGTTPGPLTNAPSGPHLAVIAGPDAGHIQPMRGDLTVGRGTRCDLVLEDPALSRAHVRCWAGPALHVADLGSANGTTVSTGARGRRVSRAAQVTPGSVIAAGHTLLEVRSGSAATSVAPSLMDNSAVPAKAATVLDGALPEVCGAPRAASVFDGGVIAVAGDAQWAQGFARAIMLDRGRQPAPGQWSEPWMRWLGPPIDREHVVILPAGGSPPPACTTVAHAGPTGVSIEARGSRRTLPPICVGPVAAEAAARRLASATTMGREVPQHVTWGDLTLRSPRGLAQAGRDTPPVAPRADGSLSRWRAVAFGLGVHGPMAIDLNVDGPHLLIAGSPGAGVSTLLDTLVYALACEHSPRDLSLVVFDFSTRAPRGYEELPHIAGTVTERDGAHASRALAALESHVTGRQDRLREASCDSFEAWEQRGGAPPRLVILAHEFQGITAQCRDFVSRLTDIAEAARTVGVHLVLATQRPAGAVTAQVRAAVSTTIALRVETDSESRDLIGTFDAARLPASTPGRGILVRGGARVLVQIARPLVTPTPSVRVADSPAPPGGTALAELAVSRWARVPSAQRLWSSRVAD